MNKIFKFIQNILWFQNLIMVSEIQGVSPSMDPLALTPHSAPPLSVSSVVTVKLTEATYLLWKFQFDRHICIINKKKSWFSFRFIFKLLAKGRFWSWSTKVILPLLSCRRNSNNPTQTVWSYSYQFSTQKIKENKSKDINNNHSLHFTREPQIKIIRTNFFFNYIKGVKKEEVHFNYA